MPRIPEALQHHPAAVTTHVVDDHDAPGGSNLEAQLLARDESVPSTPHRPAGYLQDVDGFRFPTATLAPPPAEVYRREPWTAPEVSLELPPDSSLHNTFSGPHVDPEPTDNDQSTIQVPRRRLVVVDRTRVAGTLVLDGSGNGTVEMTPAQWGGGAGTGAGVQQNQLWLVDRIVVRAGAAGTCLVYAGATGNDQDLVAVVPLAAVSFAGQVDGNAVALRPGWRVTAVVAGGGAGLTATVVAYYRLAQWQAGAGDDDV